VLDVVLGDYDQGEAHLELSLTRDRELGASIGETWDRLLRAELYLARGRRGDRAAAAEQVQSAERLARSLRLGFLCDWSARLARELAASGAPQFS
jgi:hypothetical protein